jgi:hypothetical protein
MRTFFQITLYDDPFCIWKLALRSMAGLLLHWVLLLPGFSASIVFPFPHNVKTLRGVDI